jgi:hypothetical protein
MFLTVSTRTFCAYTHYFILSVDDNFRLCLRKSGNFYNIKQNLYSANVTNIKVLDKTIEVIDLDIPWKTKSHNISQMAIKNGKVILLGNSKGLIDCVETLECMLKL